MKKLIRYGSLLGFLLTFSFVSARAQSNLQRFEANIPFDFTVAGKIYKAGPYVMRLAQSPATKILYIEDNKHRVLQTIVVMQRGDVAKNSSHLTFSGYGANWALAKIQTTERGFEVTHVKSKSALARADTGADSDARSISVDLK